MNRHTKLSTNQPYLSLNKLLFEETFEFDFFDLSSLKFWLCEIEKLEKDQKFDFEIKTIDKKCFVKFSRFQKENEDFSIEVFEKILQSKGYSIFKPIKSLPPEPLDVKQFKIKPLTVTQISELGATKSFDTRFIPTLTTDYLNTLSPLEFTHFHNNNTK